MVAGQICPATFSCLETLDLKHLHKLSSPELRALLLTFGGLWHSHN